MPTIKRKSTPWILVSAISLSILCWAGTGAMASTKGQKHVAGEKYHRHYVMGTLGAYEYGIAEHEEAHLGGWGLFFELGLVPHLELEFLVKMMGGKEFMVVPIDILLKVPFHPIPEVHPFIGFGPSMSFVFNGGVKEHYGGVVVVGSHFWASKGFGFLAEASYTLAYGHGLVHAIGGAVGMQARW
jgi:hypothetical protein